MEFRQEREEIRTRILLWKVKGQSNVSFQRLILLKVRLWAWGQNDFISKDQFLVNWGLKFYLTVGLKSIKEIIQIQSKIGFRAMRALNQMLLDEIISRTLLQTV